MGTGIATLLQLMRCNMGTACGSSAAIGSRDTAALVSSERNEWLRWRAVRKCCHPIDTRVSRLLAMVMLLLLRHPITARVRHLTRMAAAVVLLLLLLLLLLLSAFAAGLLLTTVVIVMPAFLTLPAPGKRRIVPFILPRSLI